MLRTTRAWSTEGGASDFDSDREQEKASPASRLRAAMSRLGSSSPKKKGPAAIVSTSETESDPDPIFSARRSLKDVFSRAMRDPEDSHDSSNVNSKSNGDLDADEACSQPSESTAPLSAQAASLQLLRQRLDIPEMSSRLDGSRSLNKPSQQSLSYMSEPEETENHEDSIDTARAISPPPPIADKPSLEHTVSPNGSSSLQEGETATPHRRATSTNVEIPSATPKNKARPNGDQSDSHDNTPTALKTPRPPGGWFTPVRQVADASNQSLANIRTPAPPGAWQNTPTPSVSKKGILKVRFNEADAAANQSHPFQNNVPFLNQAEDSSVDEVSESNLQTSQKVVTLCDSYGRECKFDASGKEIPAQPSTAVPLDSSPSRKAASVRVVDSLGNVIDPLSSPPEDVSSDLEQTGPEAAYTKIGARISDLKKGLEQAESRRFSLQTRRNVINTAVPHERILELAMDSRGARIEREKLLRQNHLVHSGQNGLLSKTKRIRSSLISSTLVPSHFMLANRQTILLLILSNLLLWYLFYFSAHAYVRHYFLTSYYDPFFAIIDPSNLYRIPFVQFTQLPSRWMAFDAARTRLAVLKLLSNPDGVGRRVLALIWKPLVASEIKLPS